MFWRKMAFGVLVAASASVWADIVDPSSFGFSPDASSATNAAALQTALDGGHRTVQVSKAGVYDLDRTVFIDDCTHVIFCADVILRKTAPYSNVLVNRGAWLGTTNRDIRVDGLQIRVNGFEDIPPFDSKAVGVRGQFSFYHAQRIRVNDFRILDGLRKQYAFQIADFDDFIIDGFDVRGEKDGIHINAGRRFVVRNGILRTGDDGVALNASDWPVSAPCVGTIEDGVVENVVDLPGGRCNFARVLTGATPEWHKGIILQRGETVRHGANVYFTWMPVGTNTYVSNFAPTHTQGLWKDPSGLQFLFAQSDGHRTASIRNVTFRNITLQGRRGFLCYWDNDEWARSLHPEVPVADMPVAQFAVRGLVSSGGRLVYGKGCCDVMLDGIRHPGDEPIVSFYGYGDRDIRNRILLTGSSFGERGATMVFNGEKTRADVAVSGCLSDGPVVVRAKSGAKVSVSGEAVLDRRPVYAGSVKAEEVRVRAGIGHVMEKIRAGKPITIAYLGGSITAMDGWRRLSREWLQAQYPHCKFKEVHAAIGGTGSGLGVFRLEHDALRHRPDLLFVEFATNDSGLSPESIWENFDGIVRQTWRHDPETDIVFTYTITSQMMKDYGAGMCPQAASAMEQLADYYGIPTIGFGPRVAAEVKAGRLVMSIGEVETAVPQDTPDRDRIINEELRKQGKVLFAKDGVHPALPGHGFYLESFKTAWKSMADLKPADHVARLAEPFYDARLEAAKMVPIRPEMCEGHWTALPSDDPNQRNFENRGGQMWMADTPGDKLHFKFRGTECGIYDLLGPDCGRVRITVDGKRSPRTVDRFDSFCTYYRLDGFRVFRGVDGVHEVEIEIDKDQPSREILLQRHPKEDLSQKKYDGTKLFACQIKLVGEVIP